MTKTVKMTNVQLLLKL